MEELAINSDKATHDNNRIPPADEELKKSRKMVMFIRVAIAVNLRLKPIKAKEYFHLLRFVTESYL